MEEPGHREASPLAAKGDLGDSQLLRSCSVALLTAFAQAAHLAERSVVAPMLAAQQPRYDGAEQIRGSPRRRSARIVFDKGLSHRPLVDDYEALVASNHPLELLLFVTRINGEAVVL